MYFLVIEPNGDKYITIHFVYILLIVSGYNVRDELTK